MINTSPEPRPLRAQRALFVAALFIFALWVAFLSWVYVTQIFNRPM